MDIIPENHWLWKGFFGIGVLTMVGGSPGFAAGSHALSPAVLSILAGWSFIQTFRVKRKTCLTCTGVMSAVFLLLLVNFAVSLGNVSSKVNGSCYTCFAGEEEVCTARALESTGSDCYVDCVELDEYCSDPGKARVAAAAAWVASVMVFIGGAMCIVPFFLRMPTYPATTRRDRLRFMLEALPDGNTRIVMHMHNLPPPRDLTGMTAEEKRNLPLEDSMSWFRCQVAQKRSSMGDAEHTLFIRRDFVMEDSVAMFHNLDGDDLHRGLKVRFVDEEGVDLGGIKKEWFRLVTERGIFDPHRGLFRFSAVDKWTYQPNPSASALPDYEDFFEFAGKIVGKALYEEVLLPVHLTPSFVKLLLGLPIEFQDLQHADEKLFKSLLYMRAQPVEGVFFETFSIEQDHFGETVVHELRRGGKDEPVTDENKEDFIQLRAKFAMDGEIAACVEPFLRGFYAVIDPEWLCVLTPSQFDLLMCGLPNIDLDDWRAHTAYSNLHDSDDIVVWFWRMLDRATAERRAEVLLFVTGSTLVPAGGFALLQTVNGRVQPFNIEVSSEPVTHLPRAHVCFNQLVLPKYDSYEQLCERFDVALAHGLEGFGTA